MQSPDLKILGTRSVIPPSFASNMQVYGKMSCNASEVPLIIQTEAPAMMPLSDFSQSTIHPVAEPILHQHNQLVRGPVETQMTFSNLDARSIENATPHDSSSKGQHQSWIPTSVLSSNSLMLLEEQLLSLSGLQEYANEREPMLDNSRSLQLRSHGCKFANSPTGSNIVPQFGISKGRCCLLPGDTTGNCRSPCLVSSSWEVCQMLDSTEHSDSIRMLLGSSKPRFLTSIQKSETVLSEGHQREDNLPQALDIAATEFGEQSSCSGSALVSRDGWLTNSNTFQENSRIKSSACAENDTCATPSRQNIMENDRSESLQASNERAALSPVRPTSGNDLFDLFGINYQSGGFHGSMHDVYVHGNNANSHKLSADASTCITQLDMGLDYDALNDEICSSGLFSEASPDQLLGAVVAQINSVTKQKSNDNISCKTSLTRICDSSIHTRSPAFGWIASSAQMPGECLGLSSAHIKSEVAGSSSVISRCSMDKTGGCSQKDGASISQINLWVNNGQNIISDNISAAHGQRIDEAGKLNRKRPRPGENPRPRPKDRQMIQDRVKELREIVPNGAKCSIDALLEKTIKHMLFLQSVTKHADKLKEVGEPKIMSEGGLLLKDNFEGGVTWAFEVGTQSMICPIIVEDLNPPRQMLVEMLCEERGLFLEIADLIRGLGLTILKGVMEARNDKVWARFAVEANRDVTRMEIFLSLVRLLEPNARSGIIPRGIESLNMPHNMLRPSSIPATGLADRLR